MFLPYPLLYHPLPHDVIQGRRDTRTLCRHILHPPARPPALCPFAALSPQSYGCPDIA